jgi:hypothetical protein
VREWRGNLQEAVKLHEVEVFLDAGGEVRRALREPIERLLRNSTGFEWGESGYRRGSRVPGEEAAFPEEVAGAQHG